MKRKRFFVYLLFSEVLSVLKISYFRSEDLKSVVFMINIFSEYSSINLAYVTLGPGKDNVFFSAADVIKS